MLDRKNLRRGVPLPEGLTLESVYRALVKTRDLFSMIRDKTGVVLSEIIQANNFSGLVSNVFTKMLDGCSPYKAFSDQRYPDLKNKKNGIGLEIKASNKPMKGGEGHNGHSGWHLVVCFVVLESGDIDFSQVEIANLIGYERKNSDWSYQGSRRNSNNSQRTETYITTNIGTAKLRDGTIYLDPEYCTVTENLKTQRRKLSLKVPDYSIFSE